MHLSLQAPAKKLAEVSDLRRRDREVIWHPASHFTDHDVMPPLAIRSAKGAWLVSEDGREILDGISSWWTSVHGHAHPTIVAAVQEQVARLDHVMFAGFTHEPAVALAEKLIELAPEGYGRVFFSDCGSASIEVAMKMSYQSRVQRGETERRRFATLHNSYHGETLGALAACGSSTWREPFQGLLMDVLELPCPALVAHAHRDLETDAGAAEPETERAIDLLRRHARDLTAVLVEPLIQCAGRMSMPGVGFYRRLCTEAQQLGIHVIADEIAVGFGRTGAMFASEWAGVTPDLMCLSKGLSGGVLPLACTLVRRGFEEDFAGDPSLSFLHSHTYTANPIACAAGRASLRVFDDEDTIGQMTRRISKLEALRSDLAAGHTCIRAHRQCGMVVALEVEPGRRMPKGSRLGLALRRSAMAKGVLLRPLHDTVYWMPPLNATTRELDRLAEATGEVLAEVLG